MARTSTNPKARENSAIDAEIAAHERAIAAELAAERESREADAAVNVEALEESLRTAQLQERELRSKSTDTGVLNVGVRAEVLDANRAATEARDRLQRAVDAKRAAERRIGEIDAILGAADNVAKAFAAYSDLVREIAIAQGKQRALVVALPPMRAGLADLEGQRAEHERAQLDRIAASTDAELATLLGEQHATAPVGQDDVDLDELDRAIASRRALIRRAEDAQVELARTEEELRAQARETADRYRMDRARQIETRWRAVLRALGTLPSEYVAASRILRGTKPAIEVDDLTCARAMAAVDAELPPIPSRDASPVEAAGMPPAAEVHAATA